MIGICRLCASLRKVDALINITDTNHEVCQKLRQCCQINIRMDDSLPKCVCGECLQLLRQSFVFYTKVHESQESLATLFPTAAPSGGTATLAESLAPAVLAISANTVESAASETETLSKTATRLETELKKCPVVAPIEVTEKPELASPIQATKDVSNIFSRVDKEAKSMFKKDFDQELMIDKETAYEETIDEDMVDEEIVDEEYLIDKILSRKYREVDVEEEEESTYDVTLDVLSDEIETQQKANEANAETAEPTQNRRSKRRRIKRDDTPEVEQAANLELEHLNNEEQEQDRPLLQSSNAGEKSSGETWSSYPWQCCQCSTQESSYTDLLMHCQVVHELQAADVQFKCVDCQKVIARYYSFVNHVRTRHRSALALCCDVCNDMCTDFLTLATHRRVEHATMPPDYPKVLLCANCGRGFNTQNCLQIHTKGHTDSMDKCFECSQCGHSFSRLHALKVHEKVHSGVKEFSCELCGKSFRLKVNLETHMLSHIDAKPFECGLCKKSFKTTSNLEKHMATHSDVKQYKCDHCAKYFRTKDAKLSHERTHTGEMPYKCEYCSRPFRFRSTLLSHLNTHTGNRPYACIACSHYFTNWSNFNKHMKRRHINLFSVPAKDVASTETAVMVKVESGLPKATSISKTGGHSHETKTHFTYEELVEEEAIDSPATVNNEEVGYTIMHEGVDNDVYDIIEKDANSEEEKIDYYIENIAKD